MSEYSYPVKRKLLFEIKKGMLKTKKLLKITSYIQWTRALSAISRQNQAVQV